MEIRPVEIDFFHANRQTSRRDEANAVEPLITDTLINGHLQ
jgi:hypothetical protein